MRSTALTLTLVLALAGCGGDGDNATTTGAPATTAAPAITAAPDTTWAAATTTTSAQLGDAARDRDELEDLESALDPIDIGRSIIFTASMQMQVEDVISAGEEAQVAVAGLGGILFGQETSTGGQPRSVLTFKVPPENFRNALSRLAAIGTLLSQNVYADDVTERVVDLESRITTSEASVERLRTLLEGATDLADIATLEAELMERETNLELLRGQLRTVENQVALATIVLTLSEPEPQQKTPAAELIQTAYFGHDAGAGCPGSDEFEADEADAITVCYEVTNTGDAQLGDVEVRDRGLDAAPKDLFVVAGDPEAPLQPGERLILALETEAVPRATVSPTVDATALGDAGAVLRRQVEIEITPLVLDVAADNSLPGFGDALGAGWDGLKAFFGVVTVIAGAILPWLWIPLLALGVIWWMRRRNRGERGGIHDAGPPNGLE